MCVLHAQIHAYTHTNLYLRTHTNLYLLHTQIYDRACRNACIWRHFRIDTRIWNRIHTSLHSHMHKCRYLAPRSHMPTHLQSQTHKVVTTHAHMHTCRYLGQGSHTHPNFTFTHAQKEVSGAMFAYIHKIRIHSCTNANAWGHTRIHIQVLTSHAHMQVSGARLPKLNKKQGEELSEAASVALQLQQLMSMPPAFNLPLPAPHKGLGLNGYAQVCLCVCMYVCMCVCVCV